MPRCSLTSFWLTVAPGLTHLVNFLPRKGILTRVVSVDELLMQMEPRAVLEQLVTDGLVSANRSGGWQLPRTKVWVFDTPRPGELLMNVTLLEGRNGRPLNGTDPVDHTEAEQVGRKQAREYARYFRENIPGCERSFINDMSPEVGVRQTRSIVGADRLTNDDVAKARKRPDGIVKSAWPIELHAGEMPYLYWLIDDYYEVPYNALIPAVGENIIVAGKNLRAEHQALASCRVTVQCFGYGHAAGIASLLKLDKSRRFRDIAGEEVRAELNREDARL